MRWYLITLLLAALADQIVAQNVHYEAPEVAAKVAAMLDQFHEYMNYTGPSDDIAPPLQRRAARRANTCDFWMERVPKQGIAAFNSNPSGYRVFRNVKDYGAKGDGVADDTAAINAAISDGGRCVPGSCPSSTTAPAVVYFPAGVYLISSSIIDYYYTQIIGNPNCLPIIRASARFSSGTNIGMIEANPYQPGGQLAYGSTNTFFRQIRNFRLDMTLVPVSSSLAGIHWPTGQATSIQNVQFIMSSASGTQHVGLFIENGSGGYMADLTFIGGAIGLNVGSQQFTMRNLVFRNVGIAVNQIWDWGWTYQGLSIINCNVGIAMDSKDDNGAQNVGSITVVDSSFVNTPIGIRTARTVDSSPSSGGSLIMENINLQNVPTAVQGPSGALLRGTTSSSKIAAWGQGSSYTPNGPTKFQGSITPNGRTFGMVSGIKYYARSKPSYATLDASSFLSARSVGARGDGKTDDTVAFQRALDSAKAQGKVLYVDHGNYLVTRTITIPAGAKVVGEAYAVIMSSGPFFNDLNNPQPVVKIGNTGDYEAVEWSDMIVSTKGQQKGAILIQYNIASSVPTGLWDVHTRIGGFAGSDLQASQCSTSAPQPNQNCMAAFMSFHATKQSSGLYLENIWLWVADHDIEDPQLTQITVYAGRGLLIESTEGNNWLVGTAVEHHTLYQYQFVGTKNIYAGQIQTETPYYQPQPLSPTPWPYNAAYSDPQFNTPSINGIPAAEAWGLRIVSCSNIFIYGAGLYSFFNNYSTACSARGNGQTCQNSITSIEGSNSAISIYNLNTVGTQYAVSLSSGTTGRWIDNQNGFINTIALFRTG